MSIWLFVYPIDSFSIEHGLKGGGMIFNRSPELSSGVNNVGVMFGLYFKINICNNISLQPEILYSRSQIQTSYNNLSGTKAILNEDLIVIPALVNFNVYKGLNLQAGASLSYLAGNSGKLHYNNNVTPLEFEKRTDFLLNIGAEFNSNLGFLIGGRYNKSFVNPDQPLLTNVNYSGFVQLYIGVKF